MPRRTLRARVAAGVLAALLSGCTTWHPYAGDVMARPPVRLPRGIRVTRMDGSRVMLVWPFVRGDSVLGTWNRDTVGVPLNAVSVIEREDFSVTKTVLVVVAVPLVTVGLWLLTPKSVDD